MAQNRAQIKGRWEFNAATGKCVFISHKKEDEKGHWGQAPGTKTKEIIKF